MNKQEIKQPQLDHRKLRWEADIGGDPNNPYPLKSSFMDNKEIKLWSFIGFIQVSMLILGVLLILMTINKYL